MQLAIEEVGLFGMLNLSSLFPSEKRMYLVGPNVTAINAELRHACAFLHSSQPSQRLHARSS